MRSDFINIKEDDSSLDQDTDINTKTNHKLFTLKKKPLFLISICFSFLLSVIFLLTSQKGNKIMRSLKLISFSDLSQQEIESNKKNVIYLKFKTKEPNKVVKLFDTSTNIMQYISKMKLDAINLENITDTFTFGLPGKY